MTATQAPPAGDTAQRRSAAAIVAAIAIVVAAIAAIVMFGYTPVEDFTSAADAPVPARTGTVAVVYTTPDVGECLALVTAADGAFDEFRCGRMAAGPPRAPAWTADGDLVLVGPDVPGETVPGRLVDPSTGELEATVEVTDLAMRAWPVTVATYPDGRSAGVESGEGSAALVVTAAGGDSRTVLETTGPRDYRFDGVGWSPDGRWLLVVDSRGRLLVVDAVGDEPPQVLAELGRDRWVETEPAWQQPGEPIGRVTVDG